MTNADVVREVVDWIEVRIHDELHVPDLAAKAGYSLHHFVRLFGAIMGMPPRDYILRRKLTEAARQLSRGGRRVTDVAFEFGFNDLETFTRAFRRELGLTPSAVRRGAPFVALEPRAAPARDERRCITEQPVIERSDGFHLVGWSVRVSEDDGAVGKLWERFLARARTLPGASEASRFRQLATWSEDSEDAIDILAGLIVADLSSIPIDCVGKTVPACDCMVFTHRGSVAHVGESYRAIYQDWLPGSQRKPALPFNFERYQEGNPDPYAETYSFQICVPVE